MALRTSTAFSPTTGHSPKLHRVFALTILLTLRRQRERLVVREEADRASAADSNWGFPSQSASLATLSSLLLPRRCCNSCEDVREAYRRRGWAFKNPDTIEQCRREGFSQKMQEQKNEGCQVYGFLEVNKVPGGKKTRWLG